MIEVLLMALAIVAALTVLGVIGYFVLRWLFVRMATRAADHLSDGIHIALTRAGATTAGQRAATVARSTAERLTRLGAYAAAEHISEETARAQFHASIGRVARVMDGAVTLPIVGPVGLDAVLGLVPVVGDVTSAAVGVSLVARSLKYGVPAPIVSKMLGNVLVDLVLGAIPLVGDLADLWFRGNQRNVALLRQYLESEATRAPAAPVS